MRVFKYLFAIWTAIAVYTLFSFLGGPRGIPAYNYLLSEREQQLGNIKDLEMINDELERTKNNLLYDYDTLLVHAHQMGYAYEDERFVRIVGLGNNKNNPDVTGKVYIAQYPDFISDKSIKIAALCAGILVFVFLLIFDLIDSRSR
jgi:hypothetical protein